jgi:aspartate/methionine/tyrosine aminotransferase
LPFTSVLSVKLDGIIDPKLVHIIYGLSKDLCSNGLRVGVLLSQNNPEVRLSAGTVVTFSWASSLSQIAVANVLEDETFMPWFITENRRRLAEKYDTLVDWLEARQIPYVQGGNSGFFLWVNFTEYLPKVANVSLSEVEFAKAAAKSQVAIFDPTLKEAHDVLFKAIVAGGVWIGSSENFYAERFGWFRITFSVREDIFRLGLERLAGVLDASKGGKLVDSERTENPRNTVPVLI